MEARRGPVGRRARSTAAWSLSLVGAMLGYTVLASRVHPTRRRPRACFVKAFARDEQEGRAHRHAGGDEPGHRGVPHHHAVLGQHVPVLLCAVRRHDPCCRTCFLPRISRRSPSPRPAPSRASWAFPWRFGACSPSSASSTACSLRGQAAPSALPLMSILYAPGILVYIKGKKERSQPFLDNARDRVVAAVILVAAIVSIGLLVTGTVSI